MRLKGVVLKEKSDKDGYRIVNLSKNNNQKTAKVHRLVLAAFMPSIEGKNYCNHKNGNKLDNRIENLEWVTASENHLHAFRAGLRKISPKAGTPPMPVKCIQTGEKFESTRAAARKLGINDASVRNSLRDNRMVCGKYKFIPCQPKDYSEK